MAGLAMSEAAERQSACWCSRRQVFDAIRYWSPPWLAVLPISVTRPFATEAQKDFMAVGHAV